MKEIINLLKEINTNDILGAIFLFGTLILLFTFPQLIF